MIRFDDPVTQAQYERLRSEPCDARQFLGVSSLLPHNLYSADVRERRFRRATRPHWRCTACSLDVVRAKAVCTVACAGMCSYPKCLGEG